MTITIEKKHLWIIGSVILAVLIIFGILKMCGSTNYESKAKDMKLNAKTAISLSLSILADYQDNWRSAINDSRALNADGERDFTSDFNTAISWRYAYYLKKGYINILDSIVGVVKEDMKSMANPPSKYEDVHKSIMSIYNNMNSLVSLVKQPQGSLMTFGQTVNEIAMNAEKAFNESDLMISVSEEEQSKKNSEIFSSIAMKEKIMADEMEKEKAKELQRHMKPTLENVKKFKAMGYVPISEGSNVLYKIIREGKGTIPSEESMCKVHYEGKTIDGEVFDSSYKYGKPIELRANQVIPGWSEALTHMPVGSKWEVFIPCDKAYGEREQGMIKPYSDLLFTIELLGITK